MPTARSGDLSTILAAMPLNQSVTSADVAAKTEFNSNQVGAFLRNARRQGLVEQDGSRSEKRNGNWQVVPLWRRCVVRMGPKKSIDDEHLQWMAYWRKHRNDRNDRINKLQKLEAKCRSTCNA
jgi:hypothetical protein